jgi:pyruvate formate lyase activating enzyme
VIQTGSIFDIQRFAVHDGPGIRSTVFFKGCSCRCVWCHNPESLSVRPQLEFYPSRCIGCGHCFERCPNHAHTLAEDGAHRIDRAKCVGCGRCAEECYASALIIKGRSVSLDELMETILADKPYYDESGGGVTLSGGEPALQNDFARAILAACKEAGIHTAIQTAGNYPFALLESLLPHLDMVMYDIKGYSHGIFEWFVHGDRELIFDNLKRLATTFQGTLAVRTPCVGSVNDTPEEIERIAQMLRDIGNVAYYQLVPYHGLAKVKYDALDVAFAHNCKTPSPESIRALEQLASRYVPVFNTEQGMLK